MQVCSYPDGSTPFWACGACKICNSYILLTVKLRQTKIFNVKNCWLNLLGVICIKKYTNWHWNWVFLWFSWCPGWSWDSFGTGIYWPVNTIMIACHSLVLLSVSSSLLLRVERSKCSEPQWSPHHRVFRPHAVRTLLSFCELVPVMCCVCCLINQFFFGVTAKAGTNRSLADSLQ